MRVALSHAQTGLIPADGSLLTISREQDRMHTANAATIASREAAQRFVGMALSRANAYGKEYDYYENFRHGKENPAVPDKETVRHGPEV